MNRTTLLRTTALFAGLGCMQLAPAQQLNGYMQVAVTEQTVPLRGTGFDFASLTQATEPCIDWDRAKEIDLSKEFGSQDGGEVTKLDENTDVASSLDISYRSLFKAMSSSESVEGNISNNIHFHQDKSTWVFRKEKAQQPTVIDPATVKLLPNLPTDAAGFRAACGDYYVAGYIAASKFYGILEIDKSAFDSDTKASLKDETTVDALLTSGSESTQFKAELRLAASRGLVHVIEKARGNGSAKLTAAGDFESLQADYQHFPEDFKPEPVTVILAPYPSRRSGILSAQQQVMEDNAKLWYEYRRLVDKAETAMGKPETFFPLEPGTTVRWDSHYVEGLRAQLIAQQNRIGDAINACAAEPAKCTSLRATLARDQTPDAYRKLLPIFIGWADDCVALARVASPAPDGDYFLFYRHKSRNKYAALCKNMAIGPKTYFKLEYAGPPDPAHDDGGHNYSQVAPNLNGQDYVGTMVTTVYRTVRVDPGTLRVDIHDSGGIESNTGKIGTSGGGINVAAYASAGECDDEENHTHLASGNIDLRGTQFKVDRTRSQISASGWHDGGGRNWGLDGITFSDGDQVVQLLSHWGHCAGAGAQPLFLTPIDSE